MVKRHLKHYASTSIKIVGLRVFHMKYVKQKVLHVAKSRTCMLSTKCAHKCVWKHAPVEWQLHSEVEVRCMDTKSSTLCTQRLYLPSKHMQHTSALYQRTSHTWQLAKTFYTLSCRVCTVVCMLSITILYMCTYPLTLSHKICTGPAMRTHLHSVAVSRRALLG